MDYFAWFTTICRSNYTAFFHFFYESCRPVITNLEFTLNIRSRSFSCLHNNVQSLFIKRIFIVGVSKKVNVFAKVFIIINNFVFKRFKLLT